MNECEAANIIENLLNCELYNWTKDCPVSETEITALQKAVQILKKEYFLNYQKGYQDPEQEIERG